MHTYIHVELAWRSGIVMDCHATARGSIPGVNDVFIELHVLRKLMGVPSLNDLAVEGTLNTNKKYMHTVHTCMYTHAPTHETETYSISRFYSAYYIPL